MPFLALFYYHPALLSGELPFRLYSVIFPAVLSLVSLACARITFPRPQELEIQKLPLATEGLKRNYWIYIAAVGLVAAGYVDFALIAFHFQKASSVSVVWIPLLYSIAMAVDGLSALIMGRLFDRKGISILALVTAISCLFAPLVFLGNSTGAVLGMVLWGIGMGSQESIMRAVVADLVPTNKRGSAYGVLNMIFGICWAAGSAIMGLFYDISLIYLVIFSLAAQLAAVPLFLIVKLGKQR